MALNVSTFDTGVSANISIENIEIWKERVARKEGILD